jgi:FkbM family methyltransferase
MIKSIKEYVKSFQYAIKTYRVYQWKKHILSDWLNTYIFTRSREFNTPFGFKMIARNYIANRMMMNGIFETEEVELVKTNLSHADIFIDVGANIGFYTCIARSLGKYVVAIEPQYHNLECLYANLVNNNWYDTEVFPFGLSDKPGLITLYGASGPSASIVSGWAGYSSRFKKIIPVNTIDALLGNRFNGKHLFIKIDVEGAEYHVLCGGIKTLCTSPRPTWLIEICLNEFHPGEVNPNYEATFDLFWRHGYEARMANKECSLVTPSDIEKWVAGNCSANANLNYLFIPK